MTTEAQKRAHAKLAEARKAAGKKPVTMWLSEAARDALAASAKVHGSMERAAEAAFLGLSSAEPVKPAAPVITPGRRDTPKLHRGKLDSATESVTFGPVKAAPGSLLKKPKK